MDWANPGLLGPRAAFISQLTPEKQNGRASNDGEQALRALNGILVYRRTKAEPAIADELPDRIDELEHCAMTPEQIGLYQAVIDTLIADSEQTRAGYPRTQGCRSGGHHGAQADLQPPGQLPGRRQGHRGPVRQARPPQRDHRQRVRGRREGAGLHPLRDLG